VETPVVALVEGATGGLPCVRVADLGEFLAAAQGEKQRQFGGDHHAAAAAGVEAVEPDVGADVGVAVFDEREMRFVGRQPAQALEVLRGARAVGGVQQRGDVGA